jgi:hypothetical protein
MIRSTHRVLSTDPTEAELAEADRALDELNKKHGTVFDD